VRVDVIYARLSPRKKAWIDLLGTLFFLIPFSLLVLYVGWPIVMASIHQNEMSPDPGGLPRYPIKAALLVGFFLLFLQGISEAIKKAAFLAGVLPAEEAA